MDLRNDSVRKGFSANVGDNVRSSQVWGMYRMGTFGCVDGMGVRQDYMIGGWDDALVKKKKY